jgi:hypothetical protein
MKEALLNATNSITTQAVKPALHSEVKAYSPNEVFFCPEESQFYSQCLEKMVFSQCTDSESVIEFGAGDGSPVINALLKARFEGVIHGYELNPAACELARSRVNQYQLSHQYVLHNCCFFEGVNALKPEYLIANPPYIPAPDDDICMPALHGGIDGATITKNLLSVGCENVLLMISAYSNPIETVEYAIDQGYQIVDFMVSPLQFGYYSSEPKVKNWISELRQQRKAFYSDNIYFLAGVFFQKNRHPGVDLSCELLKVMTAL